MQELISLTLENEMDLVLAQKKAIKLAEKLKLRLSTQAIFSTAIAELCRVVIDYTDTGVLSLGLKETSSTYSLLGVIQYQGQKENLIPEEKFFYAKKLVPFFETFVLDNVFTIEIGIKLPLSLSLDLVKVKELKSYFSLQPPLSTYEVVKRKNSELSIISKDKDAQLKQSKYIDDKRNEFISIASHELKTPITIIKAYTQLALARKDQCSDQVVDFLMKIDSQSTKLKNLVEQLLDTSKIENGKLEYHFEEVDLNAFIEEMQFLLNNLIPDHSLKIDLGPTVMVKIDRERMSQVFTNLISNSGKYSKTGSLVSLKTSVNKKGVLTVAVTDNGIGMAKLGINKIFDKYHRDKQAINGYSGLGMGLYICSVIIKDHGGKIWVKSTENKGSTFYFSLMEVSPSTNLYAQ